MKNKKLLLESFEKENNCKFICKRPFELVEVDIRGNVYLCYPRCNNSSFHIGNLYNSSYEEIMSSEKAIEFKNSILNSTYEYCDFNYCSAPDRNINLKTDNSQDLLAPTYPKELRLHPDIICNVKCLMCRKEYIYKHDREKEFKDVVIPRILEMCKNTEIIFMNGQGEALFSPLDKELILQITDKYPNIKFDFCSNGVNCSEEKIKEYNLEDKIKNISVSLHAIKKTTYDKIVIGGNFDKVMKNIKYLLQLINNKSLESLCLNFVVNDINYQEMIPFLNFAKENNITVFFSALQNSFDDEQLYKQIEVHNNKHKNFKKLQKILSEPVFSDSRCILDNTLMEIRNNALNKPSFKDKIFSLFKK